MIAIPSQFMQTNRVLPRDTGVVFPWGCRGEDVRIHLMTDSDAKAAACGERLHEWGLPQLHAVRIVGSQMRGIVVVNPWQPRGPDGTPRPVRFGGDVIVLETQVPENVVRFARWLVERLAAQERAQAVADAKKPPSLSALADAGEIETFDAG